MARETTDDEYLQPIATLSFEIRDEEDERYSELKGEGGYLYGMALELRQRMLRDIDGLVLETLGPDMGVISLELRPGSVHVLVIIGQICSAAKPVKDFLLDFSRYENLMKSIEKLKAQITRLFRRMFTKGGPPEQTILTISGSSIIDPAVIPPSRVPVREVGMCNVNGWLIAYLIISHAALLAVLLWLVARHLK